MQIIETPLSDLLIIQPTVFEDSRGYFFESYNENLFTQQGLNYKFVQDNQSLSHQGVVRGLHFQKPPYAQGKLVRVIAGAVLDVAVDIRKQSATYGKHYSIELTAKNKTMLWIPPGFAHGFATLENNTIFFYKCTHFYHKKSEGTIQWNDPDLAINWQVDHPIISEKDRQGELFKNFTPPLF